MNALLSSLLDILAVSVGQVRRTGRSLGDPTVWHGPDLSRWTIATAFAVCLPLAPLGHAVLRFAAAAWRLADDPMLFMLGLLFAIPAALMALTVFALATAAALWVAAALLGGRQGAHLYAAVYGVVGLGLAAVFASAGLLGYGIAMGVASAVLLAMLAFRPR